MEVTQFTYFQQVGGFDCAPVSAEITYGLERLAMYVQGIENVYDLRFNDRFRYGEVFLQNEQEFSAYNFERANTDILFQHFADAEKECKALLEREPPLALPAYDQCPEGEPQLQSARCARRDQRDRARLLYRPRAHARQSLLRSLARQPPRRLHPKAGIDARRTNRCCTSLFLPSPLVGEGRTTAAVAASVQRASACGRKGGALSAAPDRMAMPDLLLELFSEEIPARMQTQAAKDLERLVVGALSDRGLLFEAVRGFAGPRRLTLAISGLPAKQPDVSEEKKGPRINAPEKAIEGFLKSAGVTLDQCEKRADPKGDFYVAVIHRKGRATSDVLAEILPETIAKLPWPKSMRWGDGTFRWVRPLHSIIATFDGEVVPFEIAGVKSGNITRGHRFLSQGPIEVRRFEDYEKKLRDAHVILDGAERRETILHDARQKAFALGLELIEDEGLANEVMGLAEWPVVLIGQIDSAFMDVPRRNPPDLHAHASEIFRAARSRRPESSPTASPSSPTWSRRTAARRSSPATSAC